MSQAIGLIETRGMVGLVETSDAMVKAASVELVKTVQIGGGDVTAIVRGMWASARCGGCGRGRGQEGGTGVDPRDSRPHEALVENMLKK